MSGMNKKHSNVGKSGVDHDEPVGINADTIVMGCYSGSLDEFKAFAQRAKKSRATHLVITAEDLPWARWQYDVEGDPYPSWAISNVGLLKICER